MGRRELIAAFARDRYRTIRLFNRILIAHLDGRAVVLPSAHSLERQASRLLIARQLLEVVGDGGATKITEPGRWALAEILADYAETLFLADLAKQPAVVPLEPPSHVVDIAL